MELSASLIHPVNAVTLAERVQRHSRAQQRKGKVFPKRWRANWLENCRTTLLPQFPECLLALWQMWLNLGYWIPE